jgi:carboxypeptidase C (cathepsin A)
MDKFVDYVFKNPQIENACRSYSGQCQGSCIRSEHHFQYGPEFLNKCISRCKRTNDQLTEYSQIVRSTLEKQIAQCQEKTQGEKLKECIIHFQEQAYGNIKEYSDKLYEDLF